MIFEFVLVYHEPITPYRSNPFASGNVFSLGHTLGVDFLSLQLTCKSIYNYLLTEHPCFYRKNIFYFLCISEAITYLGAILPMRRNLISHMRFQPLSDKSYITGDIGTKDFVPFRGQGRPPFALAFDLFRTMPKLESVTFLLHSPDVYDTDIVEWNDNDARESYLEGLQTLLDISRSRFNEPILMNLPQFRCGVEFPTGELLDLTAGTALERCCCPKSQVHNPELTDQTNAAISILSARQRTLRNRRARLRLRIRRPRINLETFEWPCFHFPGHKRHQETRFGDPNLPPALCTRHQCEPPTRSGTLQPRTVFYHESEESDAGSRRRRRPRARPRHH